ncbi:MAG: beta-lactamase family protein, partial [Thermoplasmata archaeon]|nr:beta-lactamase family protein [Thermoplasmata archaeon]
MPEFALDKVNAALEAAIEHHGEVGLQIAAYRGDRLVLDLSAGVDSPDSGKAVTSNTVFPVFSATKAVAATAVHIQVSRQLLEYGRPIADYWPEFAQNGKGNATVMDALTHRVGIPQMPEGITPETMCDWDYMVEKVASLEPVWKPGSRTGYHAYTFGWIVGELVRRSDPARRGFGEFVLDEICGPLGIDSLWLGIPDEAESRVATLIDLPPAPAAGGLLARALPTHLGTNQEVFGRHDVRRSCHPAAGGIMNARSLARVYAMLANGGALGGRRVLPAEIAAGVGALETGDEPDAVLLKVVRKARGFYAYHPEAPDVAGLMPSRNPGNFGHPGSGGST